MSRVAKSPITIPTGVEVTITSNLMSVKGRFGQLNMSIHPCIVITNTNNKLSFDITITEKKEQKKAWAQAGTARANTANLIQGVTEGWEKKLTLIGVGYRAKVMERVLNLTLGFSHPINYKLPEGITVEAPSQTEIIIKGMDKQKVGQVAAEIRAYHPPEPYKGKGVCYIDEQVVRKEAKKK
ncbi:50S ribosomal protein L6 [Candidatus Ruthturnera calyptogenae]|uniref:Large ribosomal subunit protein uL6 n=2 Tax=Gammaproteobacteria incertae sedis TaxID=118884 RepID=RL6_RUTMC|nr:50S ribosomal protein L6 [Candidatus Ruthturnera calyptogenae]A1AVL5.1 RecName: Full=Large ribosomal subunit protein uL6; AltName: Full=50S ribosomal protein L6 [Candidatus Ruthia magnifica str. Cm (Calyptogena magnifica)]ABL01972.1 LSU ribosomal protein L6P [Candidatus Ruthia magnifica str. Cm (Calyptogena magnifica)]OOZ36429.1 50S ribosomal protein L6 [Solemya elarraichensis gill symbiont]